jgi:hypothetical protein
LNELAPKTYHSSWPDLPYLAVKLAGNFKHPAFSRKFFEDTSSAVGRQGDIHNSIAN